MAAWAGQASVDRRPIIRTPRRKGRPSWPRRLPPIGARQGRWVAAATGAGRTGSNRPVEEDGRAPVLDPVELCRSVAGLPELARHGLQEVRLGSAPSQLRLVDRPSENLLVDPLQVGQREEDWQRSCHHHCRPGARRGPRRHRRSRQRGQGVHPQPLAPLAGQLDVHWRAFMDSQVQRVAGQCCPASPGSAGRSI